VPSHHFLPVRHSLLSRLQIRLSLQPNIPITRVCRSAIQLPVYLVLRISVYLVSIGRHHQSRYPADPEICFQASVWSCIPTLQRATPHRPDTCFICRGVFRLNYLPVSLTRGEESYRSYQPSQSKLEQGALLHRVDGIVRPHFAKDRAPPLTSV
jgi:hypothetical protein